MSFTTRRLYFLRHGRADRSAYLGDDDRLRPLTDEGRERMAAQAAALAELDLGCDVILTSPLARCRQTADIVGEALGLADEVHEAKVLGPGFVVKDLKDLLDGYGHCGTLMLVGHEPDFSEVVSRLTGGSNLVLKKGGLARVDLFSGFSGLAGDLIWLIPPKVLAR
ncbi:phosphohistidine phosphatase SixA [bacterium]|nr:phosphohistidine phosphatase SixA [bacterium]